MSSFAKGGLESFCRRSGVPVPFDMDRICVGRNSEVWRLKSGSEQWLLKHYYQHSSDKRDRLETEFSFLGLLKSAGVSIVPQPLARDNLLYSALYSFLPGQRPSEIKSEHIHQAVEFIVDMNKLPMKPEVIALPNATDACFTLQEHLNLVDVRITRLIAMKLESELHIKAQMLVQSKFLPLWTRLKKRVLQETEISQLTCSVLVEDRILSPSDFGFHNALDHEGKLFFIDFEYAGWDDPAKLICDFICQPEIPVSVKQGKQFMGEILHNMSCAEAVAHRVHLLLPVHRLKWCCILLNEFSRQGRMRREHAGVDPVDMLDKQFDKARQYYNMHFGSQQGENCCRC